MNLSNSERLILIMLSELYQKCGLDGTTGVDPKFVQEAIYSGNEWGFEWRYPGIFTDRSEPRPPELTEVLSTLDMWSFLEAAYARLSDSERSELAIRAEPWGDRVEFRGFDGNHEPEYIGITRFLIEQLDRYTEFQGRDLNSHMPTVGRYRRMYMAFEPIRRRLGDRRMNLEDMIAVLNSGSAR